MLSTRLSIRKRGGSLGHYQSMEKEERFSRFRSYVMGTLIMKLGAMAAEHVFYGENSRASAMTSCTATAHGRVRWSAYGRWAPSPVTIDAVEHADDKERGRVIKRLELIGVNDHESRQRWRRAV